MNQLTFDFMNQPIPDTLPIKFYKNGIFVKAKERIIKLLDDRRADDAKAMAEEWNVEN